MHALVNTYAEAICIYPRMALYSHSLVLAVVPVIFSSRGAGKYHEFNSSTHALLYIHVHEAQRYDGLPTTIFTITMCTVVGCKETFWSSVTLGKKRIIEGFLAVWIIVCALFSLNQSYNIYEDIVNM